MGSKGDNVKFAVFSASIIAAVFTARLWNIFLGNVSLIVNGTEVHHIYFGVALIGTIGLFYRQSRRSQPRLLHLAAAGFGTGLITDELTFILFTPDTYSHYFTPVSTNGAALLTGLTLAGSYIVVVRDRKLPEEALRKII